MASDSIETKDMPKVQMVTHFTDEIEAVEFSTFRDDLTVIPPPYFHATIAKVGDQEIVIFRKIGTDG